MSKKEENIRKKSRFQTAEQLVGIQPHEAGFCASQADTSLLVVYWIGHVTQGFRR
jgi:hypothetical protein